LNENTEKRGHLMKFKILNSSLIELNTDSICIPYYKNNNKNTDLNESKFYEYVKKFMENGATILGGCCGIRPSHIKEISKLK